MLSGGSGGGGGGVGVGGATCVCVCGFGLGRESRALDIIMIASVPRGGERQTKQRQANEPGKCRTYVESRSKMRDASEAIRDGGRYARPSDYKRRWPITLRVIYSKPSYDTMQLGEVLLRVKLRVRVRQRVVVGRCMHIRDFVIDGGGGGGE